MNVVSAEKKLWDFSVAIYRREGVAEACLWLQDRHGVDVNFLLFTIWAGLGRGPLERERFERALAFSHEWSENVVARLRAVRRWMKVAGHDELPFSSRAFRSLREEIAERERRAEKLQQEVLERFVSGPPEARPEVAAAREAAYGNVGRYLSVLAVETDDAVDARVSLILESALA